MRQSYRERSLYSSQRIQCHHRVSDEGAKKKDEYKNLFISPKDASSKMDSNTLLIVVDTHRPSFYRGAGAIGYGRKGSGDRSSQEKH